MKTIVMLVMLSGVLTKVETITYKNGRVVVRTYAKITDLIPSEMEVLRAGRPYPKVSPEDVIEHREVQLANYWQMPSADDILYSTIVAREEKIYNQKVG
jgi:hypothetical protein